MDKQNSIFATNLKDLLRAKKKTQNDLAKHLGINKSAITLWVKGTNMPKANKLNEIATFLGVTTDELLDSPAIKNTPEVKRKLTIDDIESGDLQIYFSNGIDLMDLPQEQQDYILDFLSGQLLKEERKKHKKK